MTKYDVIYEEIQSRLEKGLITYEQADELNTLAYNKYSDIEVSEAEVADYIDHEMGKPYVAGGYNNNVGARQVGSEMDPDKKWDLETDYLDDEMGQSISEAAEEIQNMLDNIELENTIDRVYTAYENGVISEDEANTYLAYLDVDNYYDEAAANVTSNASIVEGTPYRNRYFQLQKLLANEQAKSKPNQEKIDSIQQQMNTLINKAARAKKGNIAG
jgi:hypothetical protein